MSKCSVETYSSLKPSASLKARPAAVGRLRDPAWAEAPEDLYVALQLFIEFR